MIPIDVGRQLFVDDFLIESSSLVRNPHRPVMYSNNPVLSPGSRDTAHLAMPYSDGVWYDPADKTFKMWYFCGYGNMICYAYSTDGKNWVEPSIPDAAVPNTNQVLQIGGQRDSDTIWMDLEDPNPSHKFKAFALWFAPYIGVYFSPDGIHWSPPQLQTIDSVSDRTTVFWNPFRKVWVDSARSSTTLPATSFAPSHYTRARYYSESPDLINWTPANPLNSFWTGPDVNDPPYAGPGGALPELYNLDAVAYESLMVGLFSWFNPGPSYDSSYAAGPDLVELGVGFSRDGFNWVRPTRGGGSNAFIPASNVAGTWNAYNTQSAGGGFLVVGDELWFYFSARTLKKPSDGIGSTGLAILRRDGFYSMDAGASQGVLTTRPVQFSGNHFFVNVNDPQGSLRVEALDSTGNVIQPFSAANSSVISTNKTLQEVTWNGAADLSSLAGRPVKFRFYLTNGELYSFWATDATGASHGYVAAGGPGFTGPTDGQGLAATSLVAADTTIAPVVTVTSPAGTVSGTVTVTATATDNVGVSSVQLKLDGNNLGNACAGSPCSYSWDTTTATNASHTLSAVALDAANNAGVAPDVTVTVANVVTPPPGGGSGPVGYWTFDSGQIASGKALDSSGNNLVGTLSGGVTPAAGQMAQALSFNGAGGSVQFGPDALTDLTGDVTLAAWVKTTNSSRTEALISRYDASSIETGYLLRTAPSGHPELRIGGYNLSGSGAKVFTDTGKLINDGQWHHVAAVITLGQGVSFYIDGAPTSTQNATVAARAGGANLTLGLNGWTPFGTYFTGSLDDVRIYNRALAAAEVASLAAGGGTPTAGKPVITPAGGTYSGSVSVTMSSSTPTATIYYTTDGSSPGTGSNQYGGALNLTSNTTLKAIAVASGMNDSAIASAAFTITAAPPPSDTVAPMVTVTSPAGTVSGTVTVTATATDNVGVSSVQLKLDGNNLGNACAGSPCSYSWDTTTATNASHTLSAVALDAANNAGVAPDVTVTVANVVTPPPGGGSGPVGYWTFDSGQIASGKALDSSGNNLVGTLSGGVTPAAGQMAQALSFNGAGGSVQFGPDALTDLTGDVTLAAWVKTTNSSRTEALISRYDASSIETGYLLRTAPSGHPELRIGGYNLSGSGAKVFTDTGKLINDGQWHHVAAVITLGQGVSFYIDGAPTSTQNATVAARAGGANLTLGLNGWTPFGTYFTGSLDDVRIYNRALAAAEVASLAAGGGTPTAVPTSAASLSVSPLSLSFSATSGAGNPAAQSTNISNAGGGTLTWSASTSQPWITVSPLSGTAPQTVSVGISTGTLGSGSYSGTITISAPGATPATRTISVSLQIADPRVLPILTGGVAHYVAPNGSPSGDGSISKPWDLTTALNQPSSVKPGDTIWLRNGVYGGGNNNYVSKLNGTSTQPVIVRQYPGERATINGGLTIYGSYTWYWGFEVADISVTSRVTSTAGSWPSNLSFPNGFDVFAPGSKFINLIVHDTRQGFGLWLPATNAEIYGSLIYNNGWQGPDRGHGHGIYTQNQTGTKTIGDNIIFQGFGLGIQCYGSGSAYIQNYVFDGNTIFNSGTLTNSAGHHDYNLLIAGGNGGPQNMKVTNTYTYHTPSDNSGLSALGWQFDSQAANLNATNNYWIGGSPAIGVYNWKGATFTGNTAYSQNGPTFAGGNLSPSTYSWNSNTYFGADRFLRDSVSNSFTSWKSGSGLDGGSVLTPGRPTGVWTFVRPNKYESGRANITIYDWALASTVQVNVSGILTAGQHYEVHNAQDFYAAPVASGTYSGGTISIPMTGLTAAPALGSGVPRQPKPAGPEFGAFVLLQQ